MKRLALVFGVVVATLAGVVLFAAFSPSFDEWIYANMVTRLAGRPAPVLARANELSVLLCGTGTPLPNPGHAGPCALIAAGDDLYIVDSGSTSTRNLLMWQVPLANVKGVFLTHFHSDHIAELGELRLQTWVAGRRAPLKVYGPPGVEDVVEGFNRAYSHDADYRTAHHSEAFLPREDADLVAVIVPMAGATAPVLETGGLTVTAIKVRHGPVNPAYGYRFDYAGRSVTISGDTSFYEPLAVAARGSDVLVHEAQSNRLVALLGEAFTAGGHPRQAKIMHDIPSYHATPVEAARIANDAHAKLLVFTHLDPPLPNWFVERAFLAGVSDVRPNGWALGRDGTLIRLPGNSDTVEQTTID
jgi:ribonuclease Z